MNLYERWSQSEREGLRRLFLEERLPIAQIAHRLQRTPASVNNAISNSGLPRRRTITRFTMPTSITPALARIHAHVCGDGHMYVKRERDDYGYLSAYRKGYYRRRYGFGYTNLNMDLIRSFMHDVKDVLGLHSRYDPKQRCAIVKSKRAWELLKRLGAGKSRTWNIHADILNADDAVAAAWILAYCDDEAHFVPNGGIRVRSFNRPGLEQAATMLRRFVPCHITPARGLYPDDSCYLVVLKASREPFLRAIGSTKLTEQ